MKSAIANTALTLSLTVTASQAAAQSLNPALDPTRSETRVSAAITIPLGHSTDTRRTAPRIDLVTRSRAPGSIMPIDARDEERRWHQRSIGFALDGSQQFMINGRSVHGTEERLKLNTGETVLVVLGALVVAGGVTVLAIRDAALDDD